MGGRFRFDDFDDDLGDLLDDGMSDRGYDDHDEDDFAHRRRPRRMHMTDPAMATTFQEYSDGYNEFITGRRLKEYLGGLSQFLDTDALPDEMFHEIMPYLVMLGKRGPALYRKHTINLLCIRLYRDPQDSDE